MKWHHDADDYAVLGWKRFVKEMELHTGRVEEDSK